MVCTPPGCYFHGLIKTARSQNRKTMHVYLPHRCSLLATPPTWPVVEDAKLAKLCLRSRCTSAAPHSMRLATDDSTARLSGRFHARRTAWIGKFGDGLVCHVTVEWAPSCCKTSINRVLERTLKPLGGGVATRLKQTVTL